VAEDRTYTTWKALGDERLKALGAGVRYLVSDRAKAFIQLAEQGFESLSMPDFLHCMHDLVQSYSLAIARGVRHAHQELQKAEAVRRMQSGADGRHQDASEVQHSVEGRRADVQRWEQVHSTYRHHLETLSLTLPPCRIDDSTPQTSAGVHNRL